uniref:Uncharacterized protein n=1 Tax=Arundo donax TaxID=35708 RepID=A0A0A9C367_ARUDO
MRKASGLCLVTRTSPRSRRNSSRMASSTWHAPAPDGRFSAHGTKAVVSHSLTS